MVFLLSPRLLSPPPPWVVPVLMVHAAMGAHAHADDPMTKASCFLIIKIVCAHHKVV